MTISTMHALRLDGAPHSETGKLLGDPKVTSGTGRALCSCGWLSEDVASGSARRKAHKEHKTSQVDTTPQDPEWEQVAADLAPEEPEEDLIGVPDGSSTIDVHYPSGRFWETLGVSGSQAVADAMKFTVLPDPAAKTIRVTAPSALLEPLSDLLHAMWEQARNALNEWRRSSEWYQSLDPKDKDDAMAIWLQGRDFTLQFAQAVGHRAAKSRAKKLDTPGFQAGLTAALADEISAVQ